MSDSYIPLSKKEEYLLDECSEHICYAAYVKLKRVMDWNTCIAGESREISYQWLSEALYKPKSQGKREFFVTRGKAKYIVKQWELVGLVTRLSKVEARQLILKLNHAHGNNPSEISTAVGFSEVQPSTGGKCNRGQQREIINSSSSYKENHLKCNREEMRSAREVQPEVQQTSITVSKPNLNINNNVELPETSPQENSPYDAALPSQPATIKKSKSKLDTEIITRLFEHWKTTFNHPKAKLDDKRKRAIRKGLKFKFTEDELTQAITGCSKSAFHMGRNEDGTVYDRLGLIFRDCEQIENFMAQADKPALPPMPKGGKDHGRRNRPETNHERVMREGNEFLSRGEPLW